MDNNNPQFRPGEPNVSKLRFYSIGIVAANKALNSNIIEVTPIEELTMIDGYIDSTTTKQTANGVDASGNSYSSTVNTGNSIQAEWIRLGDSNRMTSPDVRRGESIIIYQFGDADKYWWTTLKNDSKLRKLETVVWGISATPNEGDNADATTMYYVEFSSHTKSITLHTSQANGEQWGYDIQIDAANGKIIFKDTNQNFIKLDSLAESIRMMNASGSFVDITKAIATINTTDQINFSSPTGSWTASNSLTLSSPNLIFTE